jgi:uncharacterized Zn-binding protein involved in type VI secretion
MPGVQRKGDPDSAGGIITSGISSVKVNGRPIAVEGLSVTQHPCCGQRGCPPVHCSAKTANGSGSVKAGGKKVVLDGDADTCGHTRRSGSSNVKVGS